MATQAIMGEDVELVGLMKGKGIVGVKVPIPIHLLGPLALEESTQQSFLTVRHMSSRFLSFHSLGWPELTWCSGWR